MHPCHAAAWDYHQQGLHVIPCAPKSKRPLVKWQEFQEQQPTLEQINAWWRQWSDANVALVLGRGMFAVDADGGVNALALLRDRGIELPPCPTSRTAKGLHCLLAAPGPVPDRVALLKGSDGSQVDIRGVGIIVAPPSIHPSGKIYAWEVPLTLPLPQAPQALLDLIQSGSIREDAQASQVGSSWVLDGLRGVSEGQRDDMCARLAGYLIQTGVPPPIAEGLLLESFARNCTPPFPLQDVRKTVLSVARKHAREGGNGQPVDVQHISEVLKAWEKAADGVTPVSVGVPFPRVNYCLGGGLRAGELTLIGSRPGVGKALCLNTSLPTPNGWTTMGEIREGDRLFDEQGKPCRVVFTSPVFFDRPCYKLTFSDGSVIVSDAEHQWFTWTHRARKSAAQLALPKHRSSPFSRDRRWQNTPPSVITTEQISRSLRVNLQSGCRTNHATRVAGPLVLCACVLPVPPYTLGAWLGDGKSVRAVLYTADKEVLEQIQVDGLSVGPPRKGNAGRAFAYSLGGSGRPGRYTQDSRSLNAVLRCNGLLNNKHIPAAYLRASEDQRLRLLSGLMDTDGYANRSGLCDFCSTNKRLADGVFELVSSLGMVPRMTTKIPKLKGKECSQAWMVRFSPNRQIFHVQHKAERAQFATRRKTTNFRYIVQVEPVPSRPVRCLQVDSSSSLYLASASMIPTHNTSIALEIATHAAQAGTGVLFVSREMVKVRLVERIISQVMRIPSLVIRRADLGPQDWIVYREARPSLLALPIWITDAALSLPHILSILDGPLKSQGIGMVIVDYLQLMHASKEIRERRLQVEEISQGLKTLAVQYEIPVICLSSLSRPEQGNRDRRPALSDLRDSGALEHDSDVVFLMHRLYKETTAELILAKNRNGPVGDFQLVFTPDLVLFEMALDSEQQEE